MNSTCCTKFWDSLVNLFQGRVLEKQNKSKNKTSFPWLKVCEIHIFDLQWPFICSLFFQQILLENRRRAVLLSPHKSSGVAYSEVPTGSSWSWMIHFCSSCWFVLSCIHQREYKPLSGPRDIPTSFQLMQDQNICKWMVWYFCK